MKAELFNFKVNHPSFHLTNNVIFFLSFTH